MSLHKSSVETALLLNNAVPARGGDSRHPGSLLAARVIFTSNSSVYDQGGARPDTCKASGNKLKHRQAVCGGLVVPPTASITRYLP